MHDKKKIKSGFIWSALDSLGTQAIALATSLVLANILGPAVFGLIAMLAIFIAVANVFINSGFNAALIRKTDRDESDFATTFYFSLGVSIGCYLLLFFCAPYIAQFYQQPELTTLTRVIALVVVINTFSAIPIVKLSVSLNFKTQAKCNFIALTCSSLLALALAYFDHGVWALVAQQLALAIINVLMLNILVPWRPKRKFSKESFKNLFGFGSKLLLSGLLDTIYNNIYSLIIGKQFTAVQLGLFNQANRLSSLPAVTLTGVIQKVTFPMLSAIQHDTKKLDASYLLTLQFAAVVIFPVMFGLCIIAKPLIEILLGQEWQGTAELVSIITMALVLYPIHAINLNMLQVKGRSDLFLKLEIIKKITITLILVVTVPMGIKAMCIGMVVSSYLALFINTYYTGKLSSLTAYKQLIALLPIALITAFSAFLGYSVGMNFSSNIIQIITMLGVALGSYILILILMQRSLLTALKNTLKN
ncbi:lipopolysaccharide biosynthesis protein [Pseudoalteromonas sp. CO302Y]|uniref:lipopolysaccharide biosynthesis protein n=1 Tax=unclassified Pseudoalteromonas TaxID=194690 RepID=UPI001023D749|nr:lipopolysaccharide biosynthesis protein [Pseudoalteromonas sp. CO302Y]RZG07050.1 lipopolysaccharide biosynthesis protein [Pseudoalteromonas sp. CO133X]